MWSRRRTSLYVLAGLIAVPSAARAQAVPTDAQGGCPISPATVASFFETGSVSLNGVAKPADSTVVLAPNCGFFQWTEQMFLWLTSPAPASYGGGSHIMFSPKFFTVSPEDSAHRRTFLPNSPGRPLNMRLRATELGPHMLPAVLSRSGHVVEVQRPVSGADAVPTVRLQSGATARITAVQSTPNGLQFLGANRAPLQVRQLQLAPIQRPTVQLPDARAPVPVVAASDLEHAIQARKFVISGVPIFIDSAGNVIDVEPGQADSGVLLSQSGSLIYYITAVNDVFAYHRTMQGAAPVPDSTTVKFPLTAADGAAVKTFAATKGHTIVDPEALAIETKSSWIDASAVPNPNDYVSVTAVVPAFNTSNPKVWVPSGQKTIKLVMVGLHVVGSTNGHGEMVWGTFEHGGNAPNASYTYTSTSGQKTVAQNTSGTWVFTPNGFSGTPNVTHATWDTASGNITGVPATAAVAPTPVLREHPWGVAGSNTSLNTQVISANASVISQLNFADVRAKYFQLGTTWTIGGASPSSGGAQVGTNALANATIETFMQQTGSSSGSNCFSCHVFNTVATSHVYGALKPLP